MSRLAVGITPTSWRVIEVSVAVMLIAAAFGHSQAGELAQNGAAAPAVAPSMNRMQVDADSLGDPILDNAAVRAYVAHGRLLRELADRAEASRREYGAQRGPLDVAKLMPEGKNAADAAVRLAEQGEQRLSLARATTRPIEADREADYRAAINDLEQAGTLMGKALSLRMPAPRAEIPPTPADPLAQIPRDGEYYAPSGSELLALNRAFQKKKVQLSAVITYMSEPFHQKGHTELATEDGKYRIVLQWSDCPEQLRRAFSMRSTGPGAMKNGSRLSLEGTITSIEGKNRCYLTPETYQQVDPRE